VNDSDIINDIITEHIFITWSRHSTKWFFTVSYEPSFTHMCNEFSAGI